jgi:alkanesulfonate monooxygenase
MVTLAGTEVHLYSTCPSSKGWPPVAYLDEVRQVARWCDDAGYDGILVYTDNSLVDPWLLSQLILEETKQLAPLVALQPVYMHPYSAAKLVASLAFLHNRRVVLNMVAGGFRNDLLALNDPTEHDARYDRLVEYVTIMEGLLSGRGPVSFDGSYYTVKNLSLTPALPQELFPEIFVSGSSPAGLAAARALGATAVRYPRPPDEEDARPDDESINFGMRIGVIARDSDEAAWAVASERFPDDRKGQVTHRLAMSVSDSRWHRQLSALGKTDARTCPTPYWLGPFENYKTFCPYLVGSYETVAAELGRYLDLGFNTYILDIPPSEEELDHIGRAFETALTVVTR